MSSFKKKIDSSQESFLKYIFYYEISMLSRNCLVHLLYHGLTNKTQQ